MCCFAGVPVCVEYFTFLKIWWISTNAQGKWGKTGWKRALKRAVVAAAAAADETHNFSVIIARGKYPSTLLFYGAIFFSLPHVCWHTSVRLSINLLFGLTTNSSHFVLLCGHFNSFRLLCIWKIRICIFCMWVLSWGPKTCDIKVLTSPWPK